MIKYFINCEKEKKQLKVSI